MCCKNFISRVVPFLITFSLGLLIASFFVPVVPNFSFKNSNGRRGGGKYYRLQNENIRLKQQNQEMDRRFEEVNRENQELRQRLGLTELDLDVPPPPPAPKPYVHFDGDGHEHMGRGYGTGSASTK